MSVSFSWMMSLTFFLELLLQSFKRCPSPIAFWAMDSPTQHCTPGWFRQKSSSPAWVCRSRPSRVFGVPQSHSAADADSTSRVPPPLPWPHSASSVFLAPCRAPWWRAVPSEHYFLQPASGFLFGSADGLVAASVSCFLEHVHVVGQQIQAEFFQVPERQKWYMLHIKTPSYPNSGNCVLLRKTYLLCWGFLFSKLTEHRSCCCSFYRCFEEFSVVCFCFLSGGQIVTVWNPSQNRTHQNSAMPSNNLEWECCQKN